MGWQIEPEMAAAIISAVFGGAGLKLIEKVMGKNNEAFLEAAAIRQELRQQIEDLRAEIEGLRKELDDARQESNEWREKYWQQVQLVVSLQAAHISQNTDSE